MEIGEGVSQKFVCRKSKKCGYLVMVYAHVTGDNLWEVNKVIHEHQNHNPSPRKSKHIRKYREKHFTKSMKRKLISNHNAVVKLAKSFAWLVEEFGCSDKVPITQKDVYNHE